MNNPLLAVLIIVSVLIVVMLCWLVRIQLKLKRDFHVLDDIVQANCNDIVGICSAALAMDSKMIATEDQVEDLSTKIAEAEQNEQSVHPYSVDIRKVKSGASITELMQSSGLSHDEAALLIRLHGSKVQL